MKKNNNVIEAIRYGLLAGTASAVGTYLGYNLVNKFKAKKAEREVKNENMLLRTALLTPVILDEHREELNRVAHEVMGDVKDVVVMEMDWVKDLDPDHEYTKKMLSLLQDVYDIYDGIDENATFEDVFKRCDAKTKIDEFYEIKNFVQLNLKNFKKSSVEEELEDDDFDDFIDEDIEKEFDEERALEEEDTSEGEEENNNDKETERNEETSEES